MLPLGPAVEAVASEGRPIGRPWRVLVAESSMRPALEAGDWLLVDPTTRTWPRRGTIVVVREPGSRLLVVKRLAARPGDTVQTTDGPLHLGPAEAWLLGDAGGDSLDSRSYGAVGLDRLAGRAWLRYGPPGRPLGPIGRPGSGPGRPDAGPEMPG
jgi:signal peptidase I